MSMEGKQKREEIAYDSFTFVVICPNELVGGIILVEFPGKRWLVKRNRLLSTRTKEE
jgi:hypothetical protein